MTTTFVLHTRGIVSAVHEKKGKGVADLEIVAFLCSSAFRDAQKKKKKVNTKPWRLALGRTKQKRVQHDVLVRPAVLYCAMEWY